jgi:ankyrin repeat protein
VKILLRFPLTQVNLPDPGLFSAMALDKKLSDYNSGRFGATPLHIACYFGFPSIVKQLLNHPEIDINAVNKVPFQYFVCGAFLYSFLQKGESISDVVCRGEAVKANQELAAELKVLLAVSL